MSHVSCSGTPIFDSDQNVDPLSPFESFEFDSTANTPAMEMEDNPEVVVIEANDGDAAENIKAGVEHANAANEDPPPYTKRKRKLTSEVWAHFRLVKADGVEMGICNYCGMKIKKLKDGTTTPFRRHISDCPKMKASDKGQLNLKVLPGKSSSSSMVQNWKFDNARMREVISHMLMVHELPFNFVEYELFNVVMKEANPGFTKISRASTRQDCISSYDIGRKRIQKLLNTVDRVSITTDMWTSVQNIHYMVVTCHFVDSNFQLNKCLLSFVDVPPPYTGVHIFDSLFKCLKEWNIETKVATLTVDNAKTNDVVARNLKDHLNLQKKLLLKGKLFHVRCCAHILNLLVQDGLSEIEDIIHNVRESVKHVNQSPGRLHIFSELAKQISVSRKHLILDVCTRWNATYAMLSAAIEFKEVFVKYADREDTYKTLPSEEDWSKVEDVCLLLALFEETTKIISGSEYPTSNLFLSELYGIKEALDEHVLNGNDYMKAMAIKMQKKFDKYWGDSNLLISIAAVLDPRYKKKLLDFAFNSIYSVSEAPKHIKIVEDTLKELFQEYVDAHKASVSSSKTADEVESRASNTGSSSTTSRFGKGIKTGTAKYNQHIRSVDSFTSEKSELDTYLEEGVYIGEPGVPFDALGWWKEKNLKFRILSKMAADILSIPVTTVASESAFSAGGRVIDPHRSCLGTNMVDMLICGAYWYRNYYGIHKKKTKENEDYICIELE